MCVLAIDIETYSSVDLIKAGVYAYTDSPDFEILLFASAFDEEEMQIVDIAGGEKLPERVLNAIHDPTVVKTAFNAQFERTCIGRYPGERLAPEEGSVRRCSRCFWPFRSLWILWARF